MPSLATPTHFFEYKQKQENKYPSRCASLRGFEFFPYGKRGERAQRLGYLFSYLHLLILNSQSVGVAIEGIDIWYMGVIFYLV